VPADALRAGCRAAGGEFARHDGAIYAAAVASHVLLSLVPLVVVLAAVPGLIARSPALGRQLTVTLADLLPPGTLRERILAVTSAPAAGSGLLRLAGLLGALRGRSTTPFDVPMARPFLHSRLLDVASVAPILALVGTLWTFGCEGERGPIEVTFADITREYVLPMPSPSEHPPQPFRRSPQSTD
jgi:uncharacterized BrkB/YihY/UPF0761 family membrane protein